MRFERNGLVETFLDLKLGDRWKIFDTGDNQAKSIPEKLTAPILQGEKDSRISNETNLPQK